MMNEEEQRLDLINQRLQREISKLVAENLNMKNKYEQTLGSSNSKGLELQELYEERKLYVQDKGRITDRVCQLESQIRVLKRKEMACLINIKCALVEKGIGKKGRLGAAIKYVDERRQELLDDLQ